VMMDSGITTTRTVARWTRPSFPSNEAHCMICGDLHKMADLMLDETRPGYPTCAKCRERICADELFRLLWVLR
jgi:hypothetical protein